MKNSWKVFRCNGQMNHDLPFSKLADWGGVISVSGLAGAARWEKSASSYWSRGGELRFMDAQWCISRLVSSPPHARNDVTGHAQRLSTTRYTVHINNIWNEADDGHVLKCSGGCNKQFVRQAELWFHRYRFGVSPTLTLSLHLSLPPSLTS